MTYTQSISDSSQQNTQSIPNDRRNYLASYIQRFAAFIVDNIILIVIGLLSGTLMTDLFVNMGAWGVLVGFMLTFIYFAIGDSKLANGQTLGKRLFRIRVVDRIAANQNNHVLLSLPKSALRYLITGVPIALNGAILPSHSFAQLQSLLANTLIFGSLATFLYLAVANKQRKQLLQDIVVDSLVIKTQSTYQTVPPTPVRALKVSAVLFVVIGAIVWFANSKVQSSPLSKTLDELTQVQAVIEENPNIRHTQINSNVHTLINDNQKSVTHSLVVVAHVTVDNLSDESFAKKLALQAVNNYSQFDELDVVTVVLKYGYNIGIASSSRSHTYQFPVNELMKDELMN